MNQMLLIIVKVLIILLLVNNVIGHDKIIKTTRHLNKWKRYVTITPGFNSNLFKFDSSYPFEDGNNQRNGTEGLINNNKRWFNATPIDFNELTKKTFFKISDDIDKSSDNQLHSDVPLNSSKSSNWDQKLLNDFIKKLDPLLGKLELDGGEEMQKFLDKRINEKKINKTIPLAELSKHSLSEVAEDKLKYFTNGENQKVLDEMKKINNIIKSTNTNMSDTNDVLKKQWPSPAVFQVLPKQDEKSYASMWEPGETSTEIPLLQKLSKNYLKEHGDKETYDLIMKMINNFNFTDVLDHREEVASKIGEKLAVIFKESQKTNKDPIDGVLNNTKDFNAILNKNVKKEYYTKEQNSIPLCTPFVVRQSSTTKELLVDLMSVNASDLYTRINNVYSAPVIESTTICNMLSRKHLTYVRPECTRNKGQITCRMGRFTYVINNGDQDISNDVLSKFVALIYRRSLEGDKCFDISIVNPSSTPCVCPKTATPTTTTEAMKTDYAPITVICTPVRKDEVPLGVECGANTPAPQEIIYECKWKKIGM